MPEINKKGDPICGPLRFRRLALSCKGKCARWPTVDFSRPGRSSREFRGSNRRAGRAGSLASLGLILACLGLLGRPTGLGAEELLLDARGARSLYPTFAVFADPGARMSVAEVAARPSADFQSGFDAPPSFGMTPAVYWVRFRLRNPTDLAQWLLVLKVPRLESAKLYRLDGIGPRLIARAGLVVPYARRSYPHRDHPLRIHLDPGDSAGYLLRVRSRVAPLVMPFQVTSVDRFVFMDQWESILLGLYFGALIVMAVYNLVLFLLLRDRAFLYYSLFVFAFGWMMVIARGLNRPFLWTPDLAGDFQALPVAANLVAFLAVLVMDRYFLTLRPDPAGRFNRWLAIGLGLHFVFALVMMLSGVDGYMRAAFIAQAATMPIVIFAISIMRVVQGRRGAWYFAGGWLVLLAGVIGSMLVARGYLPYNLITYNGILFASAIEMTLISLGLVNRVRSIEIEAERLRMASDTKSLFLAHMSHEIRTPLNAVLGMSELLRETSLSAEQEKYLGVLGRAGGNLLEIVNDILDLSKIETGHLQLEAIPFRPRIIVESMLELFQNEARSRGLELSARFEGDIPDYVNGDSTRLRQILANLLSNALKFTEHGYVRVLLIGEAPDLNDPDGVRLTFEVSDSGVGIELGKWEKIFDSFSQADESTTRKYGGTGLGLAICRGLVELMGGRIGVQSFPGQGSRFYFSVRFEKGVAPDAAPAEPVLVDEDALRPLDLLVAEDNVDNQLLFRAFLKRTPHRLVMVENGAQAVRRFQERLFDLVFMDMQMPVLSGLEAVRRIRAWEAEQIAAGKRRGAVPIFALTAHALEHEREASIEAGCDGHISKPLQKARLLEILRVSSN